ncbi:MAG: hypothetical protein ACLT76_00520 [Clostridium fessum]
MYPMRQARELARLRDYCVVLMSGSFSSSAAGPPSLISTVVPKAALSRRCRPEYFEMPAAFYSTASAHEFAASVESRFLSAIGVDAVVFGGECGQI